MSSASTRTRATTRRQAATRSSGERPSTASEAAWEVDEDGRDVELGERGEVAGEVFVGRGDVGADDVGEEGEERLGGESLEIVEEEEEIGFFFDDGDERGCVRENEESHDHVARRRRGIDGGRGPC